MSTNSHAKTTLSNGGKYSNIDIFKVFHCYFSAQSTIYKIIASSYRNIFAKEHISRGSNYDKSVNVSNEGFLNADTRSMLAVGLFAIVSRSQMAYLNLEI